MKKPKRHTWMWTPSVVYKSTRRPIKVCLDCKAWNVKSAPKYCPGKP